MSQTEPGSAGTCGAPYDATLHAAMQENLQRTLPMARIDVQALPDCPDIRLGLINADFPTGPLDPDVMRAVVARPAYWALCWGSGLGLARLLYRHPAWVRGLRVVDLGSGSGVVAIAAARNGAREVIACDNDTDALMATASNARLNGVPIALAATLDDLPQCDLVLMADVLYDSANVPLLERATTLAPTVVVADSRVQEIPLPRYRRIAVVEASTMPNLGEFDEFGTVRVWASGTLIGAG
jgi:predicted nicotinamide N-methyase